MALGEMVIYHKKALKFRMYSWLQICVREQYKGL
jgi:hypothetical protein